MENSADMTYVTSTASPSASRTGADKPKRRARAPLRRLSVKQSLRHRTFWHLFAMMAFSLAYTDFLKPAMK